MEKQTWERYDAEMMKKVMDYAEGYKDYLTAGKTERECVAQSVEMAKAHGFMDIKDVIANAIPLKKGDGDYAVNMDKTIALFRIGDNILDGFNILGAHIDSPRIDIKPNPVYETDGFAYLDTHYYGGIKKYQWTAIPLAIHGVVCKKDGSVVNVVIGEDENDPVLGITDLLIHLSADQLAKTASVVIEGEQLDVLVGTIPQKGEEKEALKKAILSFISYKYF